MSYNFANLLEPENKAIGISEMVLVAPFEWFERLSVSADDGLVITYPHRLSGGKKFIEMLLMPDKNSYGAKSAGDKSTQQYNHELKVFIPGLYAQAMEQVTNLVNRPLIVLQPDCGLDASYQLGNKACFAWISAETMTGTTNAGTKGFAFTVTYAGQPCIYNPDTSIVTAGGGNGAGSALNQIGFPASIYINGTDVYVGDNSAARVVLLDIDGGNATLVAGVSGVGGDDDSHIGGAFGLSMDDAGNLVIADKNNNRIMMWAPGDTSGEDILDTTAPLGVVVTQDGRLFVAQAHQVTKFVLPDTTGVVVAGGNGAGSALNQVSLPSGLAVQFDGTVYVADSTNNRVVKWTPDATVGIVVAGGHGNGTAANQLSNPNGIFVDDDGGIYIADTNNDRVQFWAPGATFGVTVAGGNGHGAAMNQLSEPYCVAVDDDGYIYVGDIDNHRVQKWPPY